MVPAVDIAVYADKRYKPVVDTAKSVAVGIMVVRPVIALLATIVGEDVVAGVAPAKRFPDVNVKIANRRAAAVRSCT